MAIARASFASAAQLTTYFRDRYPGRTGFLSLLSRKGEAELCAITRRAIEESGCRSILDLGCGDGLLLANAITQALDRLVLVDLVEANVGQAAAALAPVATIVEGKVHDVREVRSAESFDLVLMLGVLDYLPDWRQTLHRLASTVTGWMLVDLPRSDRLWHRLRRWRLSLLGLDLFSATRRQLEGVFEGLPGTATVFPGRLSWFCIYKAPRLP